MEKKNSSKSNYIGKTINCFEIIETVRDKHSSRYRVKCTKCGDEFIKSLNDVRNFKAPSCMHCSKKIYTVVRTSVSKYNQHIGKENDAFKIIGVIKTKNNKNRIQVQCKKCGEVLVKSIMQFTAIKSDGCNNCTSKKGLIIGDFYNRYYKEYKNRVNNDYGVNRRYDKNIQFNLTLNEFTKLISSNCNYCNTAPYFSDNMKRRYKTEVKPTMGIDRRDSSKDYEVDNCVPCCQMCNYMKNDYNETDFINQISKIHNNLNKCETTIETQPMLNGVEYTQVSGKGGDPVMDHDIV